MNEPLTAERLAEIESNFRWIRRQGLRMADCDVAELLEALRWRRAGDELPEQDARVLVLSDWTTAGEEIARYRNDVWRTVYGKCYQVIPDDLWLPIPPRPVTP